jgi:hypothetical protein
MNSCQPSKISANVCCPVCGQGFLIYSEHGAQAGHSVNHRIIEHTLRSHRAASTNSSSVHPANTFHIPCWSGAHPFLASASLSNLLDSAL